MRVGARDAAARRARIVAIHGAVRMQVFERARLGGDVRALAEEALAPCFGHVGKDALQTVFHIRMYVAVDDLQCRGCTRLLDGVHARTSCIIWGESIL